MIHEQRRDDEIAVQIPDANDDEEEEDVDGVRSEASVLPLESDEEGGGGSGVRGSISSQLCCQ